MLIFKNNLYYVYIHIPKNGGKFIRNKIMDNHRNEILRAYWCTDNNFDLAHIPYIKRSEYIEPNINYHYFTYSRNPYHRLISAYFYLVELKRFPNSIDDFKIFIKNVLKKYEFKLTYDSNMIHFYPQYLFLCNEQFQIPNTIKIMKLEKHENPTIYNLSKYYDNECIEIVNHIYQKDFQLLHYSMIQNIIPSVKKFKLLL